MSNQAELEYEKQFQEDLAKATALSLEQEALDKYRRAKKYGYDSNETIYKQSTVSNSSQQDANNHGRHLRDLYVMRNHSFQSTLPPTTTTPTPRRHSEVSSPISAAAAATAIAAANARERSKTPPPERDLMTFPSPTTKSPENTSFEKMIEDLQKLQTTNPQTALVPLGPTAAAPVPQRVYHTAPPTAMYMTQPPQYPGPATGFGVGGMQLMPFVPPQQQKKGPLTNEELQKLYNMPQTVVYPPQYIGFMPPPGTAATTAYYPHYPQSAPVLGAAAAASPAAYMPTQYPNQVGFSYNTMPAAASAGHFSRPQSTPASSSGMTAGYIPASANQPYNLHSISNTSSSTGTAAVTTAAATATASNASSSNPTDLINFDVSVNMPDVFDPLLYEDNGGAGDNASDCASYYAENDPFDYLYSSGGTQYSDPVYEAVNKFDISSACSNVSSIGWRAEYNVEAEKSVDYYAASSSNRSTGPPLPPRNDGSSNLNQYNDYSTSAGTTNIFTPTKKPADNSVLDRRKHCTRLYEIVTDQRTVDDELLAFYYMVKDLRSRYLYDDDITNVGHITASEFNYRYMPNTSIKILVHPALDSLFPDAKAANATRGQFKGYGAPVVFTCDITTAVEMVIGQAFCSLEGQIRGTVNDYAVKPIGVSEWLSPTSKLSQLECVHTSLKLEKDVQLGLCLKTEDNVKVIARMQRDDARDAALRPEDILPNEMATTITYDSMTILIEFFEAEVDKLESVAGDVSNGSSRSVLSCSGVVQGVKAICALLGSIDTLEIGTCVTDLKRICEEKQLKYATSSPTSTYGQGNPEIINDCGDYAEVCLRPRSTYDQVKLKCNQLRDAVQELIELYSNVFRVDFSIRSIDYGATPISISCVLKPIVVCVNCLHRPQPNWKYDSYSLGAQLNYGTRFISEPLVVNCSNDTSGGLFARLNFSSWIPFEKNPICTLPREARLIFVLYGKKIADNEQNTDANGEKRKTATELGWCAIQLFDHKREMICGSYLLSFWPATTDKFLGPAPARGCHPLPDICPVLSIEIPPYGGRIQFPEPIENPPPAPRYDFNSLDINLQEELLNTAEQGYTGAPVQREVFWEKRWYLLNIPRALPKVLHAAHSWDYASLMDLHSLLYSWDPPTALQALELLLPGYPDAKVREKAVEWISVLPNDLLDHYLPQLLQALKHDTYEASSMARFLLCKCLESPRIAHHMYWLLVHSLPGDDPQNSIDASYVANELDESLITQARYYRRNKMMLRALLAVCGEKLLSRFLRQNMMCKNLAKLAETVKSAKESMRQKELCYGMDVVHQELIDKPTTLPLGPELEVTGVKVRQCSYFNSNTLPLKISYIGPDAEILPAIFKAGDDLQQDMLTIQLIREMNKMWLAEGLDLKIITFNCVPTGYKKGMIEMVSDAETLRKIQGEYGLTGSFKDRPIAEWLAKQNPSQLEYQRAVKNFTVSCAGYSVVTYILGICDRHNDNIMLKTSGHLFHIDFGKFLGDAQMFGSFKRDRTPFVLTPDMAYVINGGDKPSADFHYFIDLCCRAFNIIRKYGDLILHMLALMATAGIPGVNADAVSFVRNVLLPTQSNPEAAATFAKLIESSLKNWFTQFNFFLHNIAQMRFSNDEDTDQLLPFVPRKYTMQQDGRLKTVTVVRCQKHYDPEKYYVYILAVTRHGQPDPTYLFRSYKEFTIFHQRLCSHYPLAKLHSLPTGVHVGRSNIKSVADRRLPEIQKFLVSLFKSKEEISHSDLVYTFFHPLLRDQKEAKLGESKVREVKQPQALRENPYDVGKIEISLRYQRGALTVMIHHAKELPMIQGQEPTTYVKCYLQPDPDKITKRKTRVVRKTCFPTFMETLEYRMPLENIKDRILRATVWTHDALQENELLGGTEIYLSKYDLNREINDWFPLQPMPRH